LNKPQIIVRSCLGCYNLFKVLWEEIMRLVLGSDLHGYLPKVPSCDILILAGDLLPETDQERFIDQFLRRWLNDVPAKEVVATWGNHDDQPFRRWNYKLRWHLLIDQSVTLAGLKFHGTPWCLPVGRWAWQAPEYVLEKIYAMIPDDTNILISHTPPHGICDKTAPEKGSENVGSFALRDRLASLPNLKLVVCGHIHEARGQSGIVMNVSSVDRDRNLRKDPWVVMDI